jgi:hypothetical protein
MSAVTIDRLRRMTVDEIAWRAATTARAAAQRMAVRIRAPRWNRAAIARVAADGVLDESGRSAVAAADWTTLHEQLARTIRARTSRFALDPRWAPALREEVLGRWPDAAIEAAARADRIIAGRFDVLGYRGVAFATEGEIDWHLDPVHNRRAPGMFWADVPYLDPACGDHKIIWELNRHQHWLQLGRALWLTGDSRYRRAILTTLDHWLGANPPLMGINWASMLEIAFRTLSWTWALHVLLADSSADGDGPWLVDMFVGLDRQLTHVEQNLSVYFSPNTHLSGEALALYVVGTAVPELASSSRWIKTGRRILLDEIDRQIHADGGHVERSTHYQRYTLDFYLAAFLAAQHDPDPNAARAFADAATRLAEFTRGMADDAGRLPLIGDDDGGMLWPIAGRECADVRDSLALAAVLLDRPDLAPWGLQEEVIWIAGPTAIRRIPLFDAPTTQPSLSSRTFVDTGFVVARDGGGHAVFDTGRHGYMNGGHAHADALAITLSVAHRPLLIDPGTSTYTMDPMLRDRLRSSMSHNTVTLDRRSTGLPSGPFNWKTRADARLHGCRHNPRFDWAEASHDAYSPVRLIRTLFRAAGNGWLVVDDVQGDGTVEASVHWHFDPAWLLTPAPGRLRATHGDGDEAWLLHDAADLWLAHGDRETGLGWYAPVYGTLVPTWTARARREGTAPFAIVTWIGSAGPDAPSLERIDPVGGANPCGVGARIVSGRRTSVFLVRAGLPSNGNTRPPRDVCRIVDYETDARVLHYAETGGTQTELDIVDASCALAHRDGWLSITTGDRVPDLHASMADGILTVYASKPPRQLRVQGHAIGGALSVRLNGREMSPPASDRADALVIHGADWALDPPPAQLSIADVVPAR